MISGQRRVVSTNPSTENAMNDKEANATTATQREILTADETAEMLQVHVKTLYKLAEARRIPAKKSR
jgi:helix-turn-helix protein